MITVQDFDDIVIYMPILAELDSNDRKDFITRCSRTFFPKGTMLRDKKNSIDAVMLIKKGLLRIYTTGSNSSELLLYYISDNTGLLFSAPRLCQSMAIDYKIRVIEDTDAYVIPDEYFSYLERKYSKIRVMVDRALAVRFDYLLTVISSAIQDDLSTRLKKYLKYICNEFKSNDINLTHEAISRDLNCSREVVTRFLSEYKAEGLIELSRNHIKVINL